MLLSIPSRLVRFWLLGIYITSATLDTDIRLSSIVPPMPQAIDSCQGLLSSRRRPKMKRKEKRRMSTGNSGIQSKRTVLDAGAGVIRTLWTSRASREAAWHNGLMLLGAGLQHSTRCFSVFMKLSIAAWHTFHHWHPLLLMASSSAFTGGSGTCVSSGSIIRH